MDKRVTFFLDLNVLLDTMQKIGKEHWFMEGHVFVARPCERMSAWSMSCWWFPVLTKITVRDQISTVIWKRKSLKGFCLDTVLEGWEDGILKLLVQGILIHSFAIEEHILLSSNKKILYIYTYKSFDAFFFHVCFCSSFPNARHHVHPPFLPRADRPLFASADETNPSEAMLWWFRNPGEAPIGWSQHQCLFFWRVK